MQEEREFPGLISFPHGLPPNVKRAKITAKRKASEKSSKTIVEAQLESLTYKGYDFGEFSQKKNIWNYAIGVVSAKDNKMKVYPVSQAFIMRPDVVEQKPIPEKAELDYAERRESLTNEFGSKKKKRMMSAAKSNMISTDNISGASQLQNIFVQDSSEMDSELVKAAEDVVNKIKKKKRSSY